MEENQKIEEENQELFEHHKFTADKKQGLLRIDIFLNNRIENISRSKIQQAAKAGNILVNNQPVKPNYKVKPMDNISVLLPGEPREIELIPQDIPIEIVFEDDDLVIVNKKAGMVVHPAYANYTGTLANALMYYFNHKKEKGQEKIIPGLVHRIDKDTTGIMVIAKNELTQSQLARLFFNHTIERKYHALVWGDLENDQGTITGYLARSKKDRKIMDVYDHPSEGKHAVTHYKVIERFGYVTLVECRLETGRTHQIRVHFKSIGHPLFNDATYGGDKILKGTIFSKYKQFIQNCFEIIPRQALHAKMLAFNHPSTGQKLLFDSELPDDMQQVIEKWRNYITHRKSN